MLKSIDKFLTDPTLEKGRNNFIKTDLVYYKALKNKEYFILSDPLHFSSEVTNRDTKMCILLYTLIHYFDTNYFEKGSYLPEMRLTDLVRLPEDEIISFIKESINEIRHSRKNRQNIEILILYYRYINKYVKDIRNKYDDSIICSIKKFFESPKQREKREGRHKAICNDIILNNFPRTENSKELVLVDTIREVLRERKHTKERKHNIIVRNKIYDVIYEKADTEVIQFIRSSVYGDK